MSLNVGLLGAGVVGGGVVELLSKADSTRGLVLKRIAVREPPRIRVAVRPEVRIGDIEQVIEDPEVDVVIETIGGIEPALSAVRRSLIARKHVVTANKLLVARHGAELESLARAHCVEFRYEAAVCGCLPIIEMFRSNLVFDEVVRIFGILNGTTNYILTRCQDGQCTYEDALKEAQARGFAEQDPTLDVSGSDSAHKLAILISSLLKRPCRVEDIHVEGVERVEMADHRAAKKLGFRIRLLASFVRKEHEVQLRVAPTLVPDGSVLGLTTDEYNAIELECARIGWQLYLAKGAGRYPTAAAVLHDLEVIRARTYSGRLDSAPARRDGFASESERSEVSRRPQQPSRGRGASCTAWRGSSQEDGKSCESNSAIRCAPAARWNAPWLLRIDERLANLADRLESVLSHHRILVHERRSFGSGIGETFRTASCEHATIERACSEFGSATGHRLALFAIEPDA